MLTPADIYTCSFQILAWPSYEPVASSEPSEFQSRVVTSFACIRQHTSAYVSIRQHTSAYVSIRQHTSAYVSIRQHTSAYVSRGAIRQHTFSLEEALKCSSTCHCVLRSASAPESCVGICLHTYVSIRQHTSAYVSILCVTLSIGSRVMRRNMPELRQHTSAYVSIR
jgi:hypothetical protein